MSKSLKPETLCVQGGWQPKKGEPRVLPIYQSTTFKYDTSEQMAKLFDLEESGYFYTRLQNPTNDAVAAKIAALEGGVGAMLTSSGQAANFYAVFNICQAGDHMVCSSTIYGGTFNLFGVTLKKLGIEVTFVDPDATEEETTEAAMYDAVDLASYRELGVVKIDREKFVENFVRRFAENASLARTYVIEIYDVNETPPKVSLKVSSAEKGSVAGEIFEFDIENKIDAILETPY